MLQILLYVCKMKQCCKNNSARNIAASSLRILLFATWLLALFCKSMGQHVGAPFRIYVLDQATNKPLAGATFKAEGKFSIADSTGGVLLNIQGLQGFHGVFSAVGYEGQEVHFYPSRGALLDTVRLVAENLELQSVTVRGQRLTKPFNEIALASTLTSKDLDKNRGGTLAQILKTVPGLNILQTGATVGKPVVDGLYGNRVLVLNNGVKLEGQAWGAEHAPEIDPSTASSVTVLKGADGVRYGAEALGGVVLITPAALRFGDPSLHGDIGLTGVLNGRGAVGSFTIGSSFKKLPALAWRLQGSMKKMGNYKAPKYYLENTGTQEKNYAAELGYNKARFKAAVYYSQYQNSLGVFIGAHVGSVADLMARMQAKGPFDPGVFSYAYKAPYQNIKHQLLKASIGYGFVDGSLLEIKYNLQKNYRQEYDLRRGTRATTPITDLLLTTNTLDGSWQKLNKGRWHSTVGISLKAQSNYNDTITGTNPVIPNFSANSIGVYGIERLILNRNLQVEAGIRGDYQSFNAAAKRYLYQYFDENGHLIPNESVPYYQGKKTLRSGYHDYGGDRTFKNISFITGLSWKMATAWQLRSNLGLAFRAPNAEELYSYGLHQSVASIEYGDSTLSSEKGYKWVTGLSKQGRLRWNMEL